MWFPFSRNRKERETELRERVDLLTSLLNDLLWQMDTLPNTPEFHVRWKVLQALQKPRLGVHKQVNDPSGYLTRPRPSEPLQET